jgi:hypothetical protein
MKQYKRSTAIASVIAALTMFPVVAVAGDNTSHGAQTQNRSPQSPTTQSDPNMRGTPDTRAETRQDDVNMMADPVAPAPSAQPSTTQNSRTQNSQTDPNSWNQNAGTGTSNRSQSIDPAQVQKVFGSDTALIDLKSLDTSQVRSLQQTLQARGHYHGPIDGVMGPQTRSGLSAMIAQQSALNQRLISQGQITDQVAASLGVQTSEVTPVSGVDNSGNAQPSQQRAPTNRLQQSNPQQSSDRSRPSTSSPSNSNSPSTSSPSNSNSPSTNSPSNSNSGAGSSGQRPAYPQVPQNGAGNQPAPPM